MSLWDALHLGLKIVPLSKTQYTQGSASAQELAEDHYPKEDCVFLGKSLTCASVSSSE